MKTQTTSNKPAKKTNWLILLIVAAATVNAIIIYVVLTVFSIHVDFMLLEPGAVAGAVYANYTLNSFLFHRANDKQGRFKLQMLGTLIGGIIFALIWGGLTDTTVYLLPYTILAVAVGIVTGMAFEPKRKARK